MAPGQALRSVRSIAASLGPREDTNNKQGRLSTLSELHGGLWRAASDAIGWALNLAG